VILFTYKLKTLKHTLKLASQIIAAKQWQIQQFELSGYGNIWSPTHQYHCWPLGARFLKMGSEKIKFKSAISCQRKLGFPS